MKTFYLFSLQFDLFCSTGLGVSEVTVAIKHHVKKGMKERGCWRCVSFCYVLVPKEECEWTWHLGWGMLVKFCLPCQPIDVSWLFQELTNTGDLLLGEPEGGDTSSCSSGRSCRSRRLTRNADHGNSSIFLAKKSFDPKTTYRPQPDASLDPLPPF